MKFGPWQPMDVWPSLGDYIQIEMLCECKEERSRVEIIVGDLAAEAVTGVQVRGRKPCSFADPERWRKILPPEQSTSLPPVKVTVE